MDSSARDLWLTKIEQHRTIRRRELYRPDIRPTIVYDSVSESTGGLLENWIGIFQDSWRRENPSVPDIAADQEKADIDAFILDEEKLINEELASIWSHDRYRGLETYRNDGKKRLRETCAVYKHKCFVAIENVRAQRKSDLQSQAQHEERERHARKEERTYGAIVGAAIALLASFAAAGFTAWFSRSDVDVYKQGLSGLRDEMRAQRTANEMGSRELQALRSDYRQLVKWTLKSPEQIDREIARLKTDLEERKKQIGQDFSQREANLASNISLRGISNSSIAKGDMEQLRAQEALEIKGAELSTQRAIEDLVEQKKRLR